MQMYLASQPIRTTTYPYPMRIRISGRSILGRSLRRVSATSANVAIKRRHAPLGACPAIQLVAAGAHPRLPDAGGLRAPEAGPVSRLEVGVADSASALGDYRVRRVSAGEVVAGRKAPSTPRIAARGFHSLQPDAPHIHCYPLDPDRVPVPQHRILEAAAVAAAAWVAPARSHASETREHAAAGRAGQRAVSAGALAHTGAACGARGAGHPKPGTGVRRAAEHSR